MSAGYDLVQIGLRLLSISPWVLVLLLGLGLCARHLGDQRRRSMIIGIAIVILLASTLLTMLLSGFVFQELQRALASAAMAQAVVGLLNTLPLAFATLMMLYAAFYADPESPAGEVDQGE
jgi:hypothetical protein